MQERIRYEGCPFCSSKSISAYLSADCSRHPLYNPLLSKNIEWFQCGECSHVFTEGYFTDEACRIIFSKTNESQKVGHDFERNRVVSAKMVEKVLPFVSEGSWLDVGFGNGSLLFTAHEFGFKPIGIDLREDNAQALANLGIASFSKNLTEIVLEEKCAVISMADVLEHIPYPGEALAAANKLLLKGGVLLISMPNSESFAWQLLHRQRMNPYWGEIEHYHNFSRTRLYSLLNEFELTPLRYGISERYRACMEVVAQKQND